MLKHLYVQSKVKFKVYYLTCVKLKFSACPLDFLLLLFNFRLFSNLFKITGINSNLFEIIQISLILSQLTIFFGLFRVYWKLLY